MSPSAAKSDTAPTYTNQDINQSPIFHQASTPGAILDSGSGGSETIHFAELPAAYHRPLEVVAVRRLEVERAVVLLGVPVQGAEDVVTAAGDARVTNLGEIGRGGGQEQSREAAMKT